jgi:hypothetical protein
MEYIVLRDAEIEGLESDVNRYIKEGWLPQGGVSVSMAACDDDIYYVAVQAMVKNP